MVLAVTDGLGGVDILINAAARPNTGAVAGIDAFDDSEFSEQINVKVLGTGTTRRAAAARTRPGCRARDEPVGCHKSAVPVSCGDMPRSVHRPKSPVIRGQRGEDEFGDRGRAGRVRVAGAPPRRDR
jgi:NAD(P)-dependent dehydrogenase (short-subunit alcohol dehydrogenase family)